jgi:hypothetical protein
MSPSKTPKNSKNTKSTTTPVVAAVPATPAPPPTPNPADPNAAFAALVQQAITQLDAIEATLGNDPPLTATEKRHAARMRKGGTPILATIATLATQHQLESPAMQVAPMTAEVEKASALQPLANRLVAFSTHVGDLIFAAQSSAWEQGLQFYAVLQRRSLADGELAAALQPVTQFFRPKTAKAPGGPTQQQKKATKKAVTRLKKTAPQLLAETPATQAPAAPPATTTPPATPPSTPRS